MIWLSYNLDTISGYSCEAKSIISAVRDKGINVITRGLGTSTDYIKNTHSKKLSKKIHPFSYHIHHIFPHHINKVLGSYNIARTMLECNGLPKFWVDILNTMDEVWIPARFNFETFINSGVREDLVKIVHEPVNEKRFISNNMDKLMIPTTKGFKFLSLFNEWHKRKGWDILLKAYIEEFSKDEDVCLIIKSSPFFCYDAGEIYADIYLYIEKMFGRSYKELPEIITIKETMQEHDIPSLYNSVDCFVMPSRGEGWGRPYMEAMLSGLPVIGTGWSGNMEFMTNENSYLLDNRLVDIPDDAWLESYFLAGYKWAEPSISHLKSTMRSVFTKRNEAREKGIKAREDILNIFSSNKIGIEIRERLIELKLKKKDKDNRVINDTYCYLLKGYFCGLTKPPADKTDLHLPCKGKVKTYIPLAIDKLVNSDGLIKELLNTPYRRLFVYGTGAASKQLSGLLRPYFDIIGYLDGNRCKISQLNNMSIINIDNNAFSYKDIYLYSVDAIILCAYPGCYKYVIKRLREKGIMIPIIPLIFFSKMEV